MRSFNDRVKSLQQAHNNAQNAEFKNLWFDMLVRLIEQAEGNPMDCLGEMDNDTIH